MADYGIVFTAFLIGLFTNRSGLYYSLGYLYACAQCTQWSQFGALSVLLIVGVMFNEFRKSVE